MEETWLLPYILLVAILALMWFRVRGRLTFDHTLALDLHLHHQVHRVIARHRHGGTWSENSAWMRDEA